MAEVKKSSRSVESLDLPLSRWNLSAVENQATQPLSRSRLTLISQIDPLTATEYDDAERDPAHGPSISTSLSALHTTSGIYHPADLSTAATTDALPQLPHRYVRQTRNQHPADASSILDSHETDSLLPFSTYSNLTSPEELPSTDRSQYKELQAAASESRTDSNPRYDQSTDTRHNSTNENGEYHSSTSGSNQSVNRQQHSGGEECVVDIPDLDMDPLQTDMRPSDSDQITALADTDNSETVNSSPDECLITGTAEGNRDKNSTDDLSSEDMDRDSVQKAHSHRETFFYVFFSMFFKPFSMVDAYRNGPKTYKEALYKDSVQIEGLCDYWFGPPFLRSILTLWILIMRIPAVRSLYIALHQSISSVFLTGILYQILTGLPVWLVVRCLQLRGRRILKVWCTDVLYTLICSCAREILFLNYDVENQYFVPNFYYDFLSVYLLCAPIYIMFRKVINRYPCCSCPRSNLRMPYPNLIKLSDSFVFHCHVFSGVLFYLMKLIVAIFLCIALVGVLIFLIYAISVHGKHVINL